MSINKVILVGNVGRDPEVRYLERGVALATFPLATSEPARKSADGTEFPEQTEWHHIAAWRQLGEFCEKYVRKGMLLYIEGKLRTRQWTDKEGRTTSRTEIVAETLQILSKKQDQQPE
ncbi:MAG: single-stranded DNA-binding protein [Paludibacteraceae bacterium]|nr:single-stranded DNA-binding protein [Paludibacteraceae bacterium]